ncbi:ras GEF [Paxillus ammoniavirescens]|nr:ras GEF [Paxillus ammoniavirescens]
MSDTPPDHDDVSSPTTPVTVPPYSPDPSVPPSLDHPAATSVPRSSETTSMTSFSPPQSPPPSGTSLPHVLLPIPAASLNKSQSSLAFSHAIVTDENKWATLPPEVATADISIAPDGSFVETSSGHAARELKRRYDQYVGVGKDVRSPYAITAFVNQHGKQMYRVGHRDATAPAAEAESKAQQVSTSTDLSQSHGRSLKGRSRMSVHNILTQNKPKAGTTLKPTAVLDAGAPTRKLIRRTRSIPDMFGMAVSASSAEDPSRQPTPTGRTHSHSVTGADIPRPLATAPPVDLPKPPIGDIFGEVMQWPHGSVPPSPYTGSSVSVSSENGYIPYPFGLGITFDSPARRDDSLYLPMPRALREMQSFDSSLTARADDMVRRTVPDAPSPIPEAQVPSESLHGDLPSTPPRIAVSPFADDSDIPPPDPTLAPLPETSMHSRYAPEVFDVLQTYRGLPLLDRLFPDSAGETTIKMSLRADDSAAPRDDPRFVLWGEMHATPEVDMDDVSISQSSHTGACSPASSRRGKPSVDVPSLRISTHDPSSNASGRRVLLAATIERWIAQLTSDFNYDELLNFFLTYRTYISAVDLCHLLICRFHWSLSGHATKQDEMARKIVRVRTFVAIRYWLLTFFVMDFLPNRELRLLLASWLNTLVKDPVLKKHQDGLSIVRKLIKVVKDCKEAHTRRRHGSSSARQSVSTKPRPTHLLGEKFAEAISKDQDDSDVDLDFAPEERMSVFLGNGGESGNTFTFGSAGAVASPTRASGITSASAAILQQPLQRNILQQSRASISVAPGTDPLAAQSPPPITFPQRALSRVFVKTIGRLGRWRRVLNSRQTVDTGIAIPANVSAFDLELSGDLLGVRGGVEQYLKMIEPSSLESPVAAEFASSDTTEPSQPPGLANEGSETNLANTTTQGEAPTAPTPSHQHLLSVTEVAEEEEEQTETTTMNNRPVSYKSSVSGVSRAGMSIRTHSTESFGSILSSRSRLNPLVAQVQAKPPWRFNVVSIDDLELSDTSSEMHGEHVPAPPGLRKPPRKLPLRRDFEFIRRSGESVSSMGIRSRDSVASESSAVSVGGGLGNNIQQWQVNAIVDSLSDDGEDGGVEEALNRLEGQINPKRRKEKALKVDGWVRAIQERMAAGDFGDEHPRFFSEDDEEEEEEDAYIIDQHETGSVRMSFQAEEGSTPAVPSQVTVPGTSEDYFTATPSGSLAELPATSFEGFASSGPTSPMKSTDAKPAPEDVVPLEILQSRVPSRPSTSHGSPMAPSLGPSLSSPPKILPPAGRKAHRCWVLSVSADVLVQHFSMIDRELFMGIKPEELVMDDWMSCQEVDVLDWAQYLKDRARWKAESRFSQKTSALAVVRGRFNLMTNFVISEIMLTAPSDKHTLVAKFIRIAIKAYSYSNFNTLVAILAGLRSEWVNRAMQRHWNRVGPWEMQIFQKLSQFVNPENDFKAMHEAISAMVDAKPIDVRSHASTIMSNSTSDSQTNMPSACVPFVGVYLSQLYRYSKLPDLIDPTAPREPVSMDPQTVSFDSPSHPDVFESLTPLPPSMQLEPLINVHKQRLIAGAIKDLVAGQHLASRVHFPIDKKLFQKCLRIRGLDLGTLHQVYLMYSEPPPSRPIAFIPL